MNKQELIDLVLKKTDEIEELKAKIKDQSGTALIVKIICKDQRSAKRVENILSDLLQQSNLIESAVINIVDRAKVEDLTT